MASLMASLSVRLPESTATTCAPSRRMRATLSAWRAMSSVPDRKSTRLNSSHANISYAVFCLKKKKKQGLHCRAEDLLGRGVDTNMFDEPGLSQTFNVIAIGANARPVGLAIVNQLGPRAYLAH